jgi:hypothetical protein
MKKKSSFLYTAAAVSLLTVVACGDDSGKLADGGKQIDAAKIDGPPGMIDAPTPGSGFHQVEQLGRPGVAEALLITNDFLNGYNALAPSFAGADANTLAAVVGEAKTVLKAIYFGICFADGVAAGGTLTPDNSLKPGGLECPAIGGAIIGNDGKIVASVGSAASTYADAVFNKFIPDVMRIDTGVAVSTYFNLCNGSDATSPALCGGRGLTDDTIDVTLDFLFSGAAVPLDGGNGTGLNAVFQHVVSDGVGYSTSVTNLNALAVDPANSQQGHPLPSNTFPYVPAAF